MSSIGVKRRRDSNLPTPKRKKQKKLLPDGTEEKQIPRTQENTREADDTIVEPDDHEVSS